MLRKSLPKNSKKSTTYPSPCGKVVYPFFQGNTDLDGFIDFVWNLYNGDDQEEAKSEYSEQNKANANPGIKF